MIEVIPSINVQTFEEVREWIKKVEPYVSWCHLDVTDGIFSKHETWRDPADLPKLAGFLNGLAGSDPAKQGQTLFNVEVHLMIAEPEQYIEKWLIPPVKRIIVHVEAAKDLDLIIQKCREAGIEAGLAINPETPWDRLQPWFGKVDIVQTLNVHPGSSGQKAYWQETLPKIEHIRKSCPLCIIEVDGGVDPETAKKAIECGANLLVAGNYIFNAKDTKKAVEELNKYNE